MPVNYVATLRKSQSLRFIIFGVALALVGLATFAGLIVLFGDVIHYWLILLISSLMIYTLNYVVYSRRVFSRDLAWRSYVEYLAGSGLNFVLTSVFLIISIDLIGLEPVPARILVALILVPAAFFFHSGVTFRDRPPSSSLGLKKIVSDGE